jgi:hypothetical protein
MKTQHKKLFILNKIKIFTFQFRVKHIITVNRVLKNQHLNNNLIVKNKKIKN